MTPGTRFRFACHVPLLLLGAGVLVSACRQPTRTRPHERKTVAHQHDTPWHAVTMPRASNTPDASDFVWLEGESPRATNFPEHHAFEPASPAEANVLSGGRWLGALDAGQSLFAEYDFNLHARGEYEFFSRKFWLHGPFRWRVDDGPWRQVERDLFLLDRAALRTHVEVNWVAHGRIPLESGNHVLRVETTEPSGAAAFDAFVLSNTAFVPRGKLRPGQTYPEAPTGWFVFDPPTDDFSPTPIDLRRLNQVRAGADGFVEARNGQLVFGQTGRGVRFFGVNAKRELLLAEPEIQRRYARRLAKLGVNLVRLDARVVGEGSQRQPDEVWIRRIHEFVDRLAQEGIYSSLSIYFPLLLPLAEQDGFPGYTGQAPFGLSYFSEEFDGVLRSWWRALLTSRSPSTGRTLAEEPALAMVELINEDSLLFWTSRPYETIPEPQTVLLERRFGAWLTARHGSVKAALAAWGGDRVRGDEPTQGRAGFVDLWRMAHDGSVRSKEQAEFLARLMRSSYASTADYLRTLGLRAPTVCSNWHTADERVLGPLDNWANTACDVMDRHGYFSGPHEGDAASYSVRAGQTYGDESILRTARATATLPPLLEPQYAGKPAMTSEVGWPWPNRFRAEGPLLVAAYGALHGLDAVLFYASDQQAFSGTLEKFETADPMIQGQFQVAALIFRKGLVQEVPPIARWSVSDKTLFELEGAPFSARAGLDQLRLKDIPAWLQGQPSEDSPLLLLSGPVAIDFGARITRLEGPSAWEPGKSRGGEVSWDLERGFVRVNSKHAEALLGFLGAVGTVHLSHMSITSNNEYAAIALVPLDDRPIANSDRLMLSVATEASNSGWKTRVDDRGHHTILDVGQAPILEREIEAVIRLSIPGVQAFDWTALDQNGIPTWKASTKSELTLRKNTTHYLIEPQREPAP
jgi:hypothetical protein